VGDRDLAARESGVHPSGRLDIGPGDRGGLRGTAGGQVVSPARAPGKRGPGQTTPGIIPRQRLLERISQGDRTGVVLVCAPAGSGKSELARTWVNALAGTERVGWLTVERGERDAQRFWLSLIDALAGACDAVQAVDPVPQFRGEVVLERLLSQLESLDARLALVIDDLHELRSAEALEWLEVLLGALPAALHVVLLTREEPRIGLHRLRVSGRLIELRDSDLRFSAAETRELFDAGGVTLSDEGIQLLYERTEGWAAGLRLAAISLTRHPDPERFVSEFSGSERTVAEYLLAEVLAHQRPDVRELLLRTSVLQRVCGPLADHLTGTAGSERILQDLEDANAFVVSLDAGRTWFRYHHLFADLLQLELRRSAPEIVAPLHVAAADWFEQHGDPVQAIRHAQAAEDWGRAGPMLAVAHLGLILDGRLATVRGLLDDFATGYADVDPEVALVSAGVCLREGLPSDGAAYMAAARRHAATVPEARRSSFELLLAAITLEFASRGGDVAGALEAMAGIESGLGRLEAVQISQHSEIRALALINLGTTELWSLRLPDARRNLEEALELARRVGRPYLEIACLAHLAIASPLSGRSAVEALELSEAAVALAESHGLDGDPVTALALAVGSGSLTCLGRFDEAEHWLARAHRAVRSEQSPGAELALYHASGLLRLGQGRYEEALIALRRAQEMQSQLAGEHALTGDIRLRLVLALLGRGDLAGAVKTLQRLSDGERERAEGRLAAAALALAGGRPEDVAQLLAPVIEGTAPTWHPLWAALQALLFEAAASDQLGHAGAAEDSLERALDLAEPEGLILPFVFSPVAGLLGRHARHRTAHPALLAEILEVLSGASPQRRGEPLPALDPLSAAELRVVRFLPTNLKAPEIAAELFVSTNTVRTHLSHIYAKLGVHSRTEAVARARELRLLGPPRA
jgi:LuxR family maltose regulon positive regulatory protein